MQVAENYKELATELIERWRRTNIPLNPGASEADLAKFEWRLNTRLPEDFRYFYSIVDGMPGTECDRELFHLWPLEEITEKGLSIDEDAILRIVFGDSMLDALRYSIKLNKQNQCMGLYVGDAKEPSGAYYTDFIKLYLCHSDELCM